MIIARCPFTRAFTSLRMPRFEPPKIPHLSPSIINSMLSTFPSDTLKLTFFLWCANHPNYFHAPTSFDLMLPVALRLNDRLGSISAIVDDLESHGCPQKPKSLMLLLRIYWKGSMYKLALHVFDEMTRRNFVPNTYARNIVIDVLFKMGHFGEAMMFFRDTQTPNFLSFNTVLCHLSKLGDWLGVHVVLREMVKKGFHFNSGTFLVSFACFNKAGRVTELLQLLGFMIISGEQVSVIIWTNLIDCYCRVGRVDIATWLLIKMVDSGSSPNVVTYTSVIKGLSESGMHCEVLEVFSTMLSKGCAPDLVLYNVLIDSMKKARRYDDAVAIFLDLRKRKIEPDSYTLSSLMSLLSLSGKMSLLPRLVAGVDVPVDLVACNTLLHSLCKAGFLAQALEFYRDMIDKGFTPDGYTFVGLLSSLCKLGMIDNAVNVYYALVTNIPDIDAYVHTAILGELFKRGKYQRGNRLFREAVSGNYCLDAVSYTIAIHGLFQGGNFDDARNLFDQMKQSGIAPNICTYNVLLRGLCRAKDISAVKHLLEEMRIAGIELDDISLNTIRGLMFRRHCVEMCDLGMKPSRVTHSQHIDVLVRVCDGEADNLEDTTSVLSGASDLPDELPLCAGE